MTTLDQLIHSIETHNMILSNLNESVRTITEILESLQQRISKLEDKP